VDPEDLNMEHADLKSKSIDELWAWHMEIIAVLARKISLEQKQLEQRLQKLRLGASEGTARRERRPYPRVFPKYRNPDNPSETWAGRGKQPRWLTAQLGTGRTLDDFRIQSSNRQRRSSRR
jgi:DNA-binding protein H-NS